MAIQDTDEYLQKAQEFLARQTRETADQVEIALQGWAYAQSLYEQGKFIVKVGRTQGSSLWGVVDVEVSGVRESIKPHIGIRIPLFEGNREYRYYEKGIPWMARSNRIKLVGTASSLSADTLDAVQAYKAMGMEFGGKYGPFHASSSGGGQGDFCLHISEATWSVFPPSFTKAFQAVQGPHHQLEELNLHIASALFGKTAMEQYVPLVFAPSDRRLLIMETPPAEVV